MHEYAMAHNLRPRIVFAPLHTGNDLFRILLELEAKYQRLHWYLIRNKSEADSTRDTAQFHPTPP